MWVRFPPGHCVESLLPAGRGTTVAVKLLRPAAWLKRWRQHAHNCAAWKQDFLRVHALYRDTFKDSWTLSGSPAPSMLTDVLKNRLLISWCKTDAELFVQVSHKHQQGETHNLKTFHTENTYEIQQKWGHFYSVLFKSLTALLWSKWLLFPVQIQMFKFSVHLLIGLS